MVTEGQFLLVSERKSERGEKLDKRLYQTVQLGGLLHDIGKFIQRGDFGKLKIEGRHPEVSVQFLKVWGEFLKQWVDLSLLKTLLAQHHESYVFPDHLLAQKAPEAYRPLCLLVSRSDNYSSAERGHDKGGGYYKTTPLTSVFSRLKLQEGTVATPKFYRVGEIEPGKAFPGDNSKLNPLETTKCIKSFSEAMERLSKTEWVSFTAMYSHLLTLLEDYCWWLPASTQEELPDVSLYDHLRTTGAIVAALYQYHEEKNDFSYGVITDDSEEKFLLLAGDLSGIQQYIFDIANVGVGGVAKRLRARSFFLSAISTGLAHKIAHDLELPPANILSQSGGNFYVLLPNTQRAHQYVSSLRQSVNRDLLTRFGGEISLNLAVVPFSGEDFETYNQVVRRAGERLSLEKMNPLTGMLHNEEGAWKEEAFILEDPPENGQGYCKSCGKLPAKIKHGEVYFCPVCDQDVKAGSWLRETRVIAYYDRKPMESECLQLPGDLWVVLSPEVPKTTTGALVAFHLGAGDLSSLVLFPARRSFMSNHVPYENSEVLDFDALAGRSQGKKLLGVLKADVDNLGALFVAGLGKRATISRVATLSRLLETFFSGWLNSLLNEKFPNTYLVYSGGDDLLAVGPWNETIALANTIRADFARFVGYNPDVTMSAGISLIKPSYPISLAVEQVEENLRLAKQRAAKGAKEGKDQCTVLGEIVKWKDLPGLLEQGVNLAAWLEQDLLSSGFVQNLLYYAKLYDRYHHGEVEGLKYLPLLNYDMNRNLRKDVVLKWAQGLKVPDGVSIRHLAIIARYALLARRVGHA